MIIPWPCNPSDSLKFSMVHQTCILDGLLMAGSSMLHQFSITSACATIGLHVQDVILHKSGTYEYTRRQQMFSHRKKDLRTNLKQNGKAKLSGYALLQPNIVVLT